MDRQLSSSLVHRLAIVVAAAFYGAITVGGKAFAERGFSLLEISLTGVLFGTLILAPWLWARPSLRPRRQDLGLFGLFGLVGAGLQLTQFGGIVAGVPVALVALLLYSQPVWTVLLGRFWLAEPITRPKLGSVALALAGVVVLLDPADALTGSYSAVGLASALAAGLLLSVWVILARTSALRGNQPMTTAFGYHAGSAAFLVLAIPVLSRVAPYDAISRLDPGLWLQHWRLVAIYTLFAALLPALLAMWGMRRVEASSAGVLMLLEPLSAALLAWWLFAEPLTGHVLVGGALILMSNIVLLRSEGRVPA